MKRSYAIILIAALLLAFTVPVNAADTGYTDVSGGEWYAEAVVALREKNIMDGMGGGLFAPDETFTRAQLATVLYRLAGKPAVSGDDGFTDTQAGKWYSDAVVWASQTGVVNGYGNGLFGTNDPCTQQQLAVMLWRNAGSYVLGEEYASADGAENLADSWAKDGVRWARVECLLTSAVPFEPKNAATRAQVADMVYRYLLLTARFADADAVTGATEKADEVNILVAYFSCTGNTERIALLIADALEADVYRITPETPYTAEDLNYYDYSCRAVREQGDPSARPAVSGTVENLDDYDVVFLGYPIWCGLAPKIMCTFTESCDLSGKTVVPFCTSGSSPIGSTASAMSSSAPDAVWLEGRRFSSSSTEADVRSWLETLSIKDAKKAP